MEYRELIKQYFESWICNDISFMKANFHKNIRYSECYGPVYQDIEECLKWFESWNQRGKVLQWKISGYREADSSCYVDWYFVCEFEGQIDGFDGVSFIRFEEGKIIEVKEYSSTSKHVYPQNQHVIVSYDNNWKKNFELLKAILENRVHGFVSSIEHIGSTAIPGMMAKPIIDIDIVLVHREMIPEITKELSKLGYEHVGDMGIRDREVFKLDKSDYKVLSEIEHHLYVCPPESNELKRHIYFRDQLREHGEFRDKYNHIKKEILNQVGWENRRGYVELKEIAYKEFFEEVMNNCKT